VFFRFLASKTILRLAAPAPRPGVQTPSKKKSMLVLISWPVPAAINLPARAQQHSSDSSQQYQQQVSVLAHEPAATAIYYQPALLPQRTSPRSATAGTASRQHCRCRCFADAHSSDSELRSPVPFLLNQLSSQQPTQPAGRRIKRSGPKLRRPYCVRSVMRGFG
jgi:hypothetical protein